MKLELAQKIHALALDCDFDSDDIEIRPYVGRKSRTETTGIVGLKITDILAIAIENAHEFVDEDGDPIFQDVGRLQTDSMGLDTIVY